MFTENIVHSKGWAEGFRILSWAELAQNDLSPSYLFHELEKIFFLASEKRDFPSLVEQRRFFWRWTDYGFYHFPEYLYVLMRGRSLGGYLMGIPDTEACAAYLEQKIPSQLAFRHLHKEYPAHLHINMHPDLRGMGLGERLVKAFIRDLVLEDVPGVHVITSPSARNVSFYKKLGFSFESSRDWNGYPLLFLGARLQN